MPAIAPARETPKAYEPIPSGVDAVTWSYDEFLQRILEAHAGSEFWRSLPFELARKQLGELTTLGPDWDSYGAEPPNETAVDAAERILELLRTMSIPPTRVVASSEGGVAICFAEEDRYADFECFNDGDIAAVRFRGTERPIVWEVPPEDDHIKAAIEQIRAHFTA